MLCASCSGCDDADCTVAPRSDDQICARSAPTSHSVSRFSVGNASLPGSPASHRFTMCLSLSSTAPRVVPRVRFRSRGGHATSRDVRTPRSGFVVCDDLSRSVAPRCDAHTCSRRVPSLQIDVVALRRKRCVARLSVIAPHMSRLLFAAARGVVEWRVDLAERHVTARASLRSVSLRRCGPHCCTAPRCQHICVLPAHFANRSRGSLPAAHRCPAICRRPICVLVAHRPRRRWGIASRHRDFAARTMRHGASSLRSCGARRCDPHCCAQRCPKTDALRANVENRVCYAPLATPRCPAGLHGPGLLRGAVIWPH